MTDRNRLRDLPAVSTVLRRPAVQQLVAERGRERVVVAVRNAIDEARARVLAGGDATVNDEDVVRAFERAKRSSLRRVINATGVLVHTNLGRAPLSSRAIAAIGEVAAGYASLEFDLDGGDRGDRHHHAVPLLRELTGAEDAVVVNNGAAAILLALSAIAAGGEVVVSRGELVEIGGGFRVPDVLRQSGATLVEVGSTNRTHLFDYEGAMGAATAAILKVHRSNFAIVGFTSEVSVAKLGVLARSRGSALIYDAGAGSMDASVTGEADVRAAVAAGADLVTFSGDKLLGGPQAGIVAGRADLLARLRRHPLMRALRPDKLCLAALVATLEQWRWAPNEIPVVAMLSLDVRDLEARAEAMVAAIREYGLDAAVVASIARLGGGSAPTREIPSRAIRIAHLSPNAIATKLRRADVPVVGRVENGALLLDLRTVAPADDDELVRAVAWAIERHGA